MPQPKVLFTREPHGFTLIELMVVVAIAAILMAIAIPSYRAYVLKSHRPEAKNALLDLAGREERFYNMNTGTGYTTLASNLGYNGTFPVTIGSGSSTGDYQVSVCIPASGAPCSDTNASALYAIAATAIGQQLNDTSCTTYVVDSLGVQTATSSAGATTTTTCW
jgi:type IV pilus assembly protein PilE